jgi:hypothetical protein
MDNEFYDLVLGNASSSAEARCSRCGLSFDDELGPEGAMRCPLPDCERMLSDYEYEARHEQWLIAVRDGSIKVERPHLTDRGAFMAKIKTEEILRRLNGRR